MWLDGSKVDTRILNIIIIYLFIIKMHVNKERMHRLGTNAEGTSVGQPPSPAFFGKCGQTFDVLAYVIACFGLQLHPAAD